MYILTPSILSYRTPHGASYIQEFLPFIAQVNKATEHRNRCDETLSISKQIREIVLTGNGGTIHHVVFVSIPYILIRYSSIIFISGPEDVLHNVLFNDTSLSLQGRVICRK